MCAFLSLPQPRWSSAAPSSEGAGRKICRLFSRRKREGKNQFFCVPGSPCQGSCRRRRRRGSIPFSPSASRMLGSSLIRGSREKICRLFIRRDREGKNQFFCASGSPCQGSCRPRRLRENGIEPQRGAKQNREKKGCRGF